MNSIIVFQKYFIINTNIESSNQENDFKGASRKKTCASENDKLNAGFVSESGTFMGAIIRMGTGTETEFNQKDKNGNPVNTYAFFNGPEYIDGTRAMSKDEIVLNPKYYGKDATGFNKSTTTPAQGIAHEIGHDLGLDHPAGQYPATGTMGDQGTYVPLPSELKTIDDAIPAKKE